MDLDAKERARVARELLHSLDGQPDVDGHDAWTAELQRRLDDVRSGTLRTLSVQTVEAAILSRREIVNRRRQPGGEGAAAKSREAGRFLREQGSEAE